MATQTEQSEIERLMSLLMTEQIGLHNLATKVYFRAGLLACREYMARFVEAQSPEIAESIRANWWPSLGDDPGRPRLLNFDELTEGEFGTAFREKSAEEISASVEALPIALGFLVSRDSALAATTSSAAQPKE